MKILYDCIVVGGGVAGSTAAYHLSQLGYHVAILEKTQGPHHKVCGEFLSFEALEYIQEMGISLNEDIPVIKHFQLFSPRSNAGFSFPSAGRGISRYKLDEELLSNAKGAGVDVLRGVCMRSYNKEGQGNFRIETSKHDFYARHLFIATGKHDYSKDHKRQARDNSYLGLKTHIHFKSPCHELHETTILFSFPGGYGGICPVENDTMNLCFVIDKNVYKSFNSDFDAVVASLRRSNPKLDSILQQPHVMDCFFAIGFIPYGFLRRESSVGNIYFLGDQRMVIPSFTGDGMAIALSTAKNCAYEFDHRQKGLKLNIGSLQRILKVQMNWALMAQAILKSSRLIEVFLSIPYLNSFLIKTFFHKTRILKLKDIAYAHGKNVLEDSYSRC